MIRCPRLVVVLALLAGACGRKAPPTEPNPTLAPANAPPKPTLLALYRFWDTRHNEHVYTYGDGEPAAWRKDPAFNGEALVGYIAVAPQPGASRLYRAYCRDERHYFYLTKPADATDIERIEAFEVYVWTQPGDGRVAVHTCFLPDDKDAYFDRDLANVKAYAAGALKPTGKPHKVVGALFYVYPTAVQTTPPPAPKPPVTPPTEQAVRALRGMSAQVIQDRGTVTQVVFTGRTATDAVIPHLKVLPGLRTLHLNWCPVTDAVLEQTQGAWPELEELELDGTEVTDAGIALLEKSTPRLQSLGLTGNEGVTDKGMARLTKLPLRQLHVSKTRVTDAGLASVKELAALEELYCGHRAITDAGVEHLKDMSHLRSLALGETRVTDAGLVPVARLTKLEFLVLDGTAVTDAGLVHLKGLTALKRLRLADTVVTAKGEADLKKAIPGLMIER